MIRILIALFYPVMAFDKHGINCNGIMFIGIILFLGD